MMRLSTRFRKFACESPIPPPKKLMPDLAEYMTVREAAKELGFSVRGVQNLVKKSKLESLLVGRMYLVSRKSVQSYLEQTKGMSKNDPTRGKQPKPE